VKAATFRKWHVQLGWYLWWWIAIMAITGVVLTFRGSFRTPEPESTISVPVAPIEQVISLAQEHASSSAPASEIYVAHDPTDTWCIVLDDDAGTEVYMAADGSLVEVLVPERTFTGWLFDLHTGAILGRPGELASAGVGGVLLVLMGTGVWMTWRRKRRTAQREAAPSSR